MRAMPGEKAPSGICVETNKEGTTGQLLPALPCRVQAGALREESPKVHSQRGRSPRENAPGADAAYSSVSKRTSLP